MAKGATMDFEEASRFMQTHHSGVVTTYKRSGACQMSILACGSFRGGAAFVARSNTAKIANLKRDSRCTVLTLNPNWSSYVVVEGVAEVHGWDNTEHEELRMMLREAFHACGGGHSNLEEYDRVMREQRRAVVIVRPQTIYGMVR